ncbi:MAG: EAL domain-containing protein [Lachnospiraceae bacterium]|nr:EAL domain-containing protein [Lachnospiraceae bacterium]
MASKSEKKYRQIKRTHIGVSIFEFLLFMIVSTAMLAFSVQMFAAYIIDTKLATEYERIKFLAKLYDKAEEENDLNIYKQLENEDADYIVCDDNGNIIRSGGVNTCGTQKGVIHLGSRDEEVTAYRDTQRDYIYPGRDGHIELDLMRFREWMNSDEDEEEKSLDPDMKVEKFINLPIWFSVDVAGGSEHFVGKAVFSANKRDATLVSTFVAALILLIFIILITMLVSGIKNVVRQKRMIDIFFKDMVTGGNNWTRFLVMGERTLHKRKSAGQRYAVVNLVFVNYRNYCVCHSIREGEKLLVSIYRIISSSLKRKEMCAHTTSSNFALLLQYETEQGLRRRLEELIGKLETIGEDHKFSFQAGVSLIDKAVNRDGKPVKQKEIDLDTEYNNASAARNVLADADESGIAFFDDKLKEEQKWLDTVQERQQRALDNEEFLVYYQPKYDPKTTKIKGAEALIRWNSPEFGLVPPGKFIPIFEKNGFITKIDHYMLRHVAADQKKWLDKGYNCVPVSVNVSRAHFIESDLAEQIRDMVDAAGTPHDLIEIELTESAFFDDKKALINTINRLKSYGFAVSMDDFGSGYSSLNSLKDMPLDVLKLDAEFFRGESDGDRGELVVSEAIRLGKMLNMKIVAEGVEVKEQVDFLADADCDMIQGYYFAKPMPGDEYEERLKQ